jgi:potassium-transporting ATPase KdpC subunit
MTSLIRSVVVIFALLSALTGVAYPLLVTAVARATMSNAASGSLIVQDGRVRGSRLIGQPFVEPRYFWGRPSATSPAYNGGASTGSNLGPLNPALLDAVGARVQALRAADPANPAKVPVDLVTASGSGLDPHISPAAAYYQVPRVARLRGVPAAQVEALVVAHTEGRLLGVLGEPVVNVLSLNLALDAIK